MITEHQCKSRSKVPVIFWKLDMTPLPIVKVAAAHVASVFLNRAETVKKTIRLIQEASSNGARLIAFPESFIPAFPVWTALWAPIDNQDLFQRFVAESVYADGQEIAQIAAEARRCGVFVSIGISERSMRVSDACGIPICSSTNPGWS